MAAYTLSSGVQVYSGGSTTTAPTKPATPPGPAKAKLSDAQIVLLVRNNVPVNDWDEYVDMHLWAVDERGTDKGGLKDQSNRSGRFMTFRTGLYFLSAGIALLAVSSIGAALSSRLYT
jgi:hypothetical protein